MAGWAWLSDGLKCGWAWIRVACGLEEASRADGNLRRRRRPRLDLAALSAAASDVDADFYVIAFDNARKVNRGRGLDADVLDLAHGATTRLFKTIDEF